MATKNIFLLSHWLDTCTPAYGGAEGFSRKTLSSQTTGHSSHSEEWRFKNHTGTHLDVPFHFFEDGKKLSDYNPDFFYFNKVQLLDCPANANQIILPDKLKGVVVEDCEFLLLRTGFEKCRGEESYWKNNPGIDPQVAIYLREHCPNIRAIGFDFISLTSYQNRELGKEAHKAFLEIKKEILIIEDMHLVDCRHKNFSALVAPLMVKNADGSPVSVYGFL